VVREGGGERPALVVVAGDQVDRHGQRRQQVVQAAVLVRAPPVDQIARREHDVGARLQREQMLHGAREVRRGVDAPVGERPFGLDMRVGDLGDQHALEVSLNSRPTATAAR
jgi:hypothetical protein